MEVNMRILKNNESITLTPETAMDHQFLDFIIYGLEQREEKIIAFAKGSQRYSMPE